MVVRTIEMLLEYVCIMLCIHKLSKEKIRINIWMVLIFLVEWIMMIWMENESISFLRKAFIYVSLFFYTRCIVSKTWKNAIKILGLMTVIVLSLQLLVMLLATIVLRREQHIGIIVNIVVLLICAIWKEKYWSALINVFKNINGLIVSAIIYVGLLIELLYMSSKNGTLKFADSIQLWLEIVILSLLFVYLFIEENKNKQKVKELQMYQLYNQAFEETIATIRIRQHEFKNHINAIKCMRYSIQNKEELMVAQEQYCNDVLQESEIGNLLKLQIEPALVGFLYAKITTAEEEGVNIKYKVESIEIVEKIKVYELIELIGVLFDNAVEALEEDGSKRIILELLKNKNGFELEIANISRIYTNNEMEQFCIRGYTTKGEKHGIGLARVKEIVKKANAELLIQNQMYDDENYLSFKVSFK